MVRFTVADACCYVCGRLGWRVEKGSERRVMITRDVVLAKASAERVAYFILWVAVAVYTTYTYINPLSHRRK